MHRGHAGRVGGRWPDGGARSRSSALRTRLKSVRASNSRSSRARVGGSSGSGDSTSSAPGRTSTRRRAGRPPRSVARCHVEPSTRSRPGRARAPRNSSTHLASYGRVTGSNFASGWNVAEELSGVLSVLVRRRCLTPRRGTSRRAAEPLASAERGGLSSPMSCGFLCGQVTHEPGFSGSSIHREQNYRFWQFAGQAWSRRKTGRLAHPSLPPTSIVVQRAGLQCRRQEVAPWASSP